MRLLVSVVTPEEAVAAVRGGADVVDAKDPRSGALGAVALPVFTAIKAAVAGGAPVSAAIGDAEDPAEVERIARAFAREGAAFVKLGFAGLPPGGVRVLLDAALQATSGVVAVAYADAHTVGAPPPEAVVEAAVLAGARGILIDTADKTGQGLTGLVPLASIARWVSEAQRAGLVAALAGRLTLDDVAALAHTGADIVGVRGAACDGGRSGTVSQVRVRALREAAHAMSPAAT